MFTSRRISTSGASGFQDSRSCYFNNNGDNQIIALGSALDLDVHDAYYSFSWWSKRDQVGVWDGIFWDNNATDLIIFDNDYEI